MKIPTEFRIIDTRYEVVYSPDLAEISGCLGQARYHEQRVYLQTPTKYYHKSEIEQVFWHEVLHCIFKKLGYEELRDDEKFVDTVASCLNQILSTMK